MYFLDHSSNSFDNFFLDTCNCLEQNNKYLKVPLVKELKFFELRPKHLFLSSIDCSVSSLSLRTLLSQAELFD